MPRERKPLTKRRIEQATVPPGAWQLTLWDTIVSGFGVRCLPGGSKKRSCIAIGRTAAAAGSTRAC